EGTKAQAALIEQIIRHQLAKDLATFLDHVDVQALKTEEPQLSSVWTTMKENGLGELIKGSYKPSPAGSCRNERGERVGVSSRIGDWGAIPCYDAQFLAGDYRDLDELAIRVRLVASTFHEYAHEKSFDDDNGAYLVTGYVRMTAPYLL